MKESGAMPWRIKLAQLGLAKKMRAHAELLTDALLGSSTPPGSAAAEEEQQFFGTAIDLLTAGADAIQFLATDGVDGAALRVPAQEAPAPEGPWVVERDVRYYGDRTATIYRVHWSSRVKFESEEIAEAEAVRDALNAVAGAASPSGEGAP